LRTNNIYLTVGVVSNTIVGHGKRFVARHRLAVEIKTAWCDMSLVKAYSAGLKEMIKSDKANRMQFFFFVSGFDIPISNAVTVRSILKKRQSCIAIVYKSYKITEHTQWLHLRREDATVVANFTNWDLLPPIPPSKFCPDEWVPFYILNNKGSVSAYKNDSLTDMERTKHSPKSPINWTSWDVKMPIYRGTRTMQRDLKNVLKDAIKDNFVFFRKVTSLNGKTSAFIGREAPWLI
jgi:hypothetical protein